MGKETDGSEVRSTGRQCACGGVIRKHSLAESREAWTCHACGRYEVVERVKALLTLGEPVNA